jgi:hypothetical protein
MNERLLINNTPFTRVHMHTSLSIPVVRVPEKDDFRFDTRDTRDTCNMPAVSNCNEACCVIPPARDPLGSHIA